MIYWFFGYPGIGKDYCATKFAKLFNLPYVHLDDFLTNEDKQKLVDGTFTADDRLAKLKRIVKYFKQKFKKGEDIVTADTLPDERSRQFIKDSFEKITFILVKVDYSLHRERIKSRKNHFFTEKILDDYIKKHWEEVNLEHIVLENNKSEEELGRNLINIYQAS